METNSTLKISNIGAVQVYVDDEGQERMYQTKVDLAVLNLKGIELLAIDASNRDTPEYYFIQTGDYFCNGISFNAKAIALFSDITTCTYFFYLPEQLLSLTSNE